MSDRPNLADELPEPPDRTLLILKIDIDGEYQVIQRSDELARQHSEHDDERWFDVGDQDSDGLDWHEALKYATKVYACGQVLASL